MYCKKCGTANDDGAVYCKACASPMNEEEKIVDLSGAPALDSAQKLDYTSHEPPKSVAGEAPKLHHYESRPAVVPSTTSTATHPRSYSPTVERPVMTPPPAYTPAPVVAPAYVPTAYVNPTYAYSPVVAPTYAAVAVPTYTTVTTPVYRSPYWMYWY